MKLRILFFLFFLGLNGLTTTSFAQTIYDQEIEVVQGNTFDFNNFTSVLPPQVGDIPQAGNELLLIPHGGNDYSIRYIPDPEFLGKDGFSVEVTLSFNPFNPSATVTATYIFQIDVVASVVHSFDDFIKLTSYDEIVIDALANDEITSTDLTLKIAQVLRGEAVVNEDYTITYTPLEDSDETDYIIYTVKDELGTISTAIINLSQEVSITEELTIKEYVIASGNSQYIVLPNEDFTINTEDYENGSVEQVSSFVYKYTANTNLEGSDIVHFTDSNENEYHASISIIEKYTDEGFVRDDVFYSASNTNTHIDVTLNDINDQYVISDYSEELVHLGSGVFSYTPVPYFTGVKEFFYTADNGFSEETGTIELVISNFKPTNYFEYNLSTPANQPRIIEYDVPLESEYFEIASMPSNGSVEIFTEEESVDLGCDEGIQKVFAVYTPDADFTGLDDFTIKYCASDNNLCSEVNISLEVIDNDVEGCICIDDCVWPGDANGDGKVSVVDALSIGRYIGEGGDEREVSPFGAIYKGSSSEDWNSVQANGKNIKHADANGDGLISVEDLDAVIDNYGAINSIISEDILGIKSVPFFLTLDANEIETGDLLTIFVNVGSEAYPAIDIHGLSFAVNLNSDIVDSSTVEVDYLESSYFVKDAPYLDFTYQPIDGSIHTAGTKTNSIGSTGSGIVATVSFIVEDAEGFKEESRGRSASNSTSSNNSATIEVNDIIIEDSRGFRYALANTSIDIRLKGTEDVLRETSNELIVFPNPSYDFVNISSEDGSILQTLNIYSVDGRLMKTINKINSNEASVRVNDLEDGLYIVKASSENNIYSSKMIKK